MGTSCHHESASPLETILGRTKVPFIIWTDHANLQYWKLPRNLNRCAAQWHADLQEYNYQLEYIPRKTNTVVDALSRPTGIDQGQEDNRGVTVLAQQICILHTPTGQVMVPNVKELKRAIVSKVHDAPTAGVTTKVSACNTRLDSAWSRS